MLDGLDEGLVGTEGKGLFEDAETLVGAERG